MCIVVCTPEALVVFHSNLLININDHKIIAIRVKKKTNKRNKNMKSE